MGRPRTQRRPVVDLKVREVEVVQYQCWGYKASLTVTPPGLGADRRHSDRTKVLSVVLWGLGLSYAEVERVMKGLGVPISDVGARLNMRAMGAEAMKRQQQAVGKIKTSVPGADETEGKLSGHGVTLGFLTDPSTGEIVGREVLRAGRARRWRAGCHHERRSQPVPQGSRPPEPGPVAPPCAQSDQKGEAPQSKRARQHQEGGIGQFLPGGHPRGIRCDCPAASAHRGPEFGQAIRGSGQREQNNTAGKGEPWLARSRPRRWWWME